jgi:hypothetical protein
MHGTTIKIKRPQHVTFTTFFSFLLYDASARFRAMGTPISFLQPSVSFAAAFHARVYSKSTASKQHPPIYFWSFPRAIFHRNISFFWWDTKIIHSYYVACLLYSIQV